VLDPDTSEHRNGLSSDLLRLVKVVEVSSLIDRGSLGAWQSAGSEPVDVRARARVDELLEKYEPKSLAPEIQEELWKIVEWSARSADLDSVPHHA